MFVRITSKLKKICFKALLALHPFYKKIHISFPDMSMYIYGIKLLRHFGLGKDFPRNLCHEPICSEYLIALLIAKPKSVFWDCGSAIGYYSILVKYASQNKSNVHAFEANSFYNRYINKSIKDFTKGGFTLNNVILDEKDNAKHISLDSYAKDNGFPDIIKMDLDGFESSALKGMEQIFKKANPYFLLEVHFKGDYKSRLNIIKEIIPEDKYSFSISINHRSRDASWLNIDTLDELPKEKQDNMSDPDYILLCVPV